jgi:hypothetical protein
MSQLKVNTIRHTGASSDAITLASDGTATGKFTNLPGRNLIVNGSCTVAQRGTSSTSDGIVAVDRFTTSIAGTDENPTTSQVEVTSADPGPWEKGFRKALRITNGNQTGGAGAADRIVIQYKIEAQDIARSGWDYTSSSSYITLSFWCKSHSVAQNFYGHFTSVDGTAQSYIFETGSLTAATWKYVTVKIPGNSNITVDDNTDQGFYFEWVLFRGTDKTAAGKALNTWAAFDGSARVPDMTSTWYTTNDAQFEITGVQLEVGDTATDFEHLSYGDDLAKCQRYYYEIARGDDKVIGHTMFYNDTSLRTAIRYPVQMRTTPSVKTSNDSGHFSVYAGSGSGSGTQSTTFDTFNTSPPFSDNNAIVVASTVSDNNQNGQAGYIATQHANAYLCLDAEL